MKNNPVSVPKVSIIVPVYNTERYLRHCVESIRNQTLKDIEIILVNDGSPDRCPEICDECATKDKRIRVIHKENGGVSSARNVGMDISRGEFIGFVDPDDYVGPEYFGNMFQTFQKHTDADLIVSGLTFISGANKRKITCGSEYTLDKGEFCNEFFKLQKQGYVNPIWNKLYKTEVLVDIRFELGNNKAQDLLFNLEYFIRCRKFVFIPQYEYFYILRDTSVTVKASREYIREYELERSLSFIEKKISLYVKNGIPWKDIEKYSLSFHPVWFYITIKNVMARRTPYNFQGQIKQIREILKYRKIDIPVRIDEKGTLKFIIYLCYYLKHSLLIWTFLKAFFIVSKISRYVRGKK